MKSDGKGFFGAAFAHQADAHAGASADILIGLAILYRPTSRQGLYAALKVG
jgi:hypothetical protein